MLGLGIRLFAAYRQVASVISSRDFWNNLSTHWEDETQHWEDIG